MSDEPSKSPLWYVPVQKVTPAFDAVADASVLKLAKDIPIVARQGMSVRIDFFPFNTWERELLDPEKHIYDEEGRCYRYDLWAGQLSFARTKEDVKDAPDSDWPERHRPKPGSLRWRRKHVMDVMIRDMGCRRSMSNGMQDIATCKALMKDRIIGGEHYVVKAQRAVMYFQNIDAALGVHAPDVYPDDDDE